MNEMREYCRSHPRRAIGAGVVVAVGLGVGVLTAWLSFSAWNDYQVTPLGIVVSLPAPPQLVSGGDAQSPTVVESRSPHLATVLAGFPRSSTPDGKVGAQFQIDRAMKYLATRPGITKLTYEVTTVPSATPPAWQVSGICLNQEVPSRVVGTFVDTDTRSVHILCLFSEEKNGMRAAQRVLRSVAILPSPAK